VNKNSSIIFSSSSKKSGICDKPKGPIHNSEGAISSRGYRDCIPG